MARQSVDFVGPDGVFRSPVDFSLVLGEPLYPFRRRAHLANDALMMVRQWVVVIALVAWLPLLLLSAIKGWLLSGSAALPAGRGSAHPLPRHLALVHGARHGEVVFDAILRLAVATLVPIAPLLLTTMRLEELVKMLFGILF